MELNDIVSVGYESGVKSPEPVAKADVAAPSDESEIETKTSAVEETDAEPEDKSSDESDDEAKEGDSEEKSEDEHTSKKSGADKRIEKLLKRETAARQEAEQLRARLEALEARSQPQSPVETVEEEFTPSKPEPSPEDFNTNAEYVRALVRYEKELEHEKHAVVEQKQAVVQAQQEAQARIDAAVKRGAEKYEDWQEVITATKTQPTVEIVQYLLEKDVPAEDLMYYFSKNTDEYEAICRLKGLAVSRAMAKVESKITALDKQTSKSAAPIKPVSAKSAPSTGLRDDISTDEWLKRRREQKIGNKRR